MKLKKTHISNKKFEKLVTLPKLFPYRLDWRKTLIEFALSSNYWKIPKTYSINEERIDEIVKIIRILE